MNKVENKRYTALLCPHNKVGIIPCSYAKIDIYVGVAQSAERRPSKAEAGGSLPLSHSRKVVRGSKSGCSKSPKSRAGVCLLIVCTTISYEAAACCFEVHAGLAQLVRALA